MCYVSRFPSGKEKLKELQAQEIFGGFATDEDACSKLINLQTFLYLFCFIIIDNLKAYEWM